MIYTAIAVGFDGKYPVWHKHSGLAKTFEDANWMFKHTGWSRRGHALPSLCGYIKPELPRELTIRYATGRREVWILGEPLCDN